MYSYTVYWGGRYWKHWVIHMHTSVGLCVVNETDPLISTRGGLGQKFQARKAHTHSGHPIHLQQFLKHEQPYFLCDGHHIKKVEILRLGTCKIIKFSPELHLHFHFTFQSLYFALISLLWLYFLNCQHFKVSAIITTSLQYLYGKILYWTCHIFLLQKWTMVLL